MRFEKMDFNNYYSQQAKQTIPVFRAAPYQRGSGIGNVFKRIFRWIVPIIKEHALPIVKSVGKEALKSAVNIASDTINGKDFKTSKNVLLLFILSEILLLFDWMKFSQSTISYSILAVSEKTN